MTSNVKLLPLPKHSGKATDMFGQKTKLYSGIQMQDYALANVLHHTALLRYALDNAARDIKTLRGVMDSHAAEIVALRAERNEKRREWEREMAADGWQVSSHCAHTADSACYCDCGNGGLCEHKWDGEPWQSADGCGWSATCSRCGITAMSHSLRTAP